MPREKHRTGVLHGVKPLKAWCTVFSRISSWYGILRHGGPWQYDLEPRPAIAAQIQRDFSSSFVVTLCLEEPERIPDKADIAAAVGKAEQLQRLSDWQQLRTRLAQAHANLDTEATVQHVTALAAVLAEAAIHAKKLTHTATAKV